MPAAGLLGPDLVLLVTSYALFLTAGEWQVRPNYEEKEEEDPFLR